MGRCYKDQLSRGEPGRHRFGSTAPSRRALVFRGKGLTFNEVEVICKALNLHKSSVFRFDCGGRRVRQVSRLIVRGFLINCQV